MLSRVFTRSLVTTNHGAFPPHMKEFLEMRLKKETFDRILTSKLKIICAPENEGYCLGELKVEPTYLNAPGTMHGGALATLLDAITTYALYNTPIRQPGVSVDLKLSFIKPVKKDDVILLEGRVRKSGSKLAFLDGSIYLKENDQSYELKNNLLVACGQHIKFVTQK